MRERRLRQAAQIDHIRARALLRLSAFENHGQADDWGIDDLGENAHVVTAQIDGCGLAAKKARQILDLIRPAHKRHAEVRAQRREVAATAPRHHDAQGLERG